MTDLTTHYLGLALRSPVVASSSPMTGDLDDLARLDDAGVGAVVLPSLFEEQLVHEAVDLDRMLSTGADASPEASGYFPWLDDYNTGPDRYLTLVERARDRLSVPVVASLNAASLGGWIRHAHLLQAAGADAVELNVYRLAADALVSGTEVDDSYVELVGSVAAALDVPLAVKLGPFFSSLPHLAGRLERAGAKGLVLFNRFYQPDLDLDTLEVRPRLVLSTPDELRLPLRWLAILRPQVDCSLAATTGVHTAEDALKAIAVGADVVMMASALLRHGHERVAEVTAGIERWLADREYVSIAQLRGSAAVDSAIDPSAYERANYLQTITSFSTKV